VLNAPLFLALGPHPLPPPSLFFPGANAGVVFSRRGFVPIFCRTVKARPLSALAPVPFPLKGSTRRVRSEIEFDAGSSLLLMKRFRRFLGDSLPRPLRAFLIVGAFYESVPCAEDGLSPESRLKGLPWRNRRKSAFPPHSLSLKAKECNPFQATRSGRSVFGALFFHLKLCERLFSPSFPLPFLNAIARAVPGVAQEEHCLFEWHTRFVEFPFSPLPRDYSL